MDIDLTRISEVVEPAQLSTKQVAVVGCGGSHHLATSLARSGVRRFVLIDGDRVQAENLCRADFLPDEIGRPKVEALGSALRRLGADVVGIDEFFTPSHANVLPACSLIIAASDSHAGQAAVNQVALRQRIPSLFVGLAQRGLGGEIVFWRPGLPCYRCLVGKRYPQNKENREDDPLTSEGITIFDVTWADAIAGQLALGLLLQGTSSRFAQLVDELDDRNYLRLKIDPAYRIAGRDLVRRELGIADDNNRFSGWCVSAQPDPAGGTPPCADCMAAAHCARDES